MLSPEKSGVAIVDLQDSLMDLVTDPRNLVHRLSTFLQVPKQLDIPIRATELTPGKLGTTVSPIREAVPETRIITRNHYNCMKSASFRDWIEEKNIRQLILVGIMTNVCILQTGLTALASEDPMDQIQIPSDGVGAESGEDHGWALNRLDKNGATITTLRTITYEWIQTPDRDEFSDLLPVLKELSGNTD